MEGAQLKRPPALRNLSWASQTSPFGWDVQGVFPAGSDGSEINAVDVATQSGILACADNMRAVSVGRDRMYCI